MRRTIAVAVAVGVLAGLGGTGVGLALARDGSTTTMVGGPGGVSMMGTYGRDLRAPSGEDAWSRAMVGHHMAVRWGDRADGWCVTGR